MKAVFQTADYLQLRVRTRLQVSPMILVEVGQLVEEVELPRQLFDAGVRAMLGTNLSKQRSGAASDQVFFSTVQTQPSRCVQYSIRISLHA